MFTASGWRVYTAAGAQDADTDEQAFGQAVASFMIEYDIQKTLKQFVDSCLGHSRELRFASFHACLQALETIPNLCLQHPFSRSVWIFAEQKLFRTNTELCGWCIFKLKPVPWKLKQQPGNCCCICMQKPIGPTRLVLEASRLQPTQ